MKTNRAEGRLQSRLDGAADSGFLLQLVGPFPVFFFSVSSVPPAVLTGSENHENSEAKGIPCVMLASSLVLEMRTQRHREKGIF